MFEELERSLRAITDGTEVLARREFDRLTEEPSPVHVHLRHAVRDTKPIVDDIFGRLLELTRPRPDNRLTGALTTKIPSLQSRTVIDELPQYLTRNLYALLLSAQISRLATRKAKKSEIELLLVELGKWLPMVKGVASDGAIPISLGDPSPEGALLLEVCRAMGQKGEPVVTLLGWCLHWLGGRNPILQSSPKLEIPVIEVSLEDGTPYLSHLQLSTMLSGGNLELGQAPDHALALLSQDLRNTLQEIWSSVAGPSCYWSLRRQNRVPCRGDSLGLAAAIGFARLKEPVPTYAKDVLLLGRFHSQNRSEYGELSWVDGLQKKLACAALEKIRLAGYVPSPHELITEDHKRIWGEDRMQILEVKHFPDAMELVDSSDMGPQLRIGQTVLGGRYILQKPIDAAAGIWQGEENDLLEKRRTSVLIQVWEEESRVGSGASHFWRQTWNNELRNLSRLSGVPNAANCLLRLRDAGVDRSPDRYVLVMQSESGHESLAHLLNAESRKPWLDSRELRDWNLRRRIWHGLTTIAEGLELLHNQHIIHRNVRAESVYCDGNDPDSLRLGGFVWTMRLGGGFDSEYSNPSVWVIPPEWLQGHRDERFSPAHDWWGFGMTAARCLLNLEDLVQRKAAALHDMVRTRIEQSSLFPAEKQFLLDLLDRHQDTRLNDDVRVQLRLHEVLRADSILDGSLGVVIPKGEQALLDLLDATYTAYPEQAFDPDRFDQAGKSPEWDRLKRLISQDLRGAHIFAFADQPEVALERPKLRYGLAGENQVYELRPLAPRFGAKGDWHLAMLLALEYEPEAPAADWRHSLQNISLKVYTRFEQDRASREPHLRWDKFGVLPDPKPLRPLETKAREFEQFLRAANQCDLLMRRSEVYGYKQIGEREVDQGVERIRIQWERSEDFAALQRQSPTSFLTARQEDSSVTLQVHLHPEPTLQSYAPKAEEAWNALVSGDTVVLSRPHLDHLSPPPQNGFLCSDGMWAAIVLIERRQQAIDRLLRYGYLLRALTNPDSVLLSSGDRSEQAIWRTRLDDSNKVEIIDKILACRPLFVLQGPPGTGKTKLISHLMDAILEDDPGAQVLITAQANAAVDVLRGRIEEVIAAANLPTYRRPILLRLGRKSRDPRENANTLRKRTAELLEEIAAALIAEPPKTETAGLWQRFVDELRREHVRTQDVENDLDEVSSDDQGDGPAITEQPPTRIEQRTTTTGRALEGFRELVHESATLVFATTSGRDLNYLVRENRMYDWVVIEEAGKAHGIDLVLPMQAGSRWLLLGDSRQLPPYRLEDYRRLLGSDLKETVNMLRTLQKTARGDPNANERTRLVDPTFLDWWDKQNKDVKDRFSTHITDSWLKTFEQIDRRIRKRRVQATGSLTKQYRMHSDIGSLISNTYYQHHGLKLENVDATLHLAHRLIQPAQFDGVAIVWVNVAGEEKVEPPRYNPAEAQAVCRLVDSLALPGGEQRTLAILSPYAQQVQLLRQRLPPTPRSPQFRYQRGLSTARDDDPPERAHTVDSFQGNEADIVVISLVRQNSETTPAKSLGFLGDARRMNVLMSRATSLLILVGNWEFFQSRVEMVRSHPPKAREGEDWDSFVRLFEELARLRSQKRMKLVPYSELVSP